MLLSDDPDGTSEVCIDGRHPKLKILGLEEMLEVIDETEELVRPACDQGC